MFDNGEIVPSFGYITKDGKKETLSFNIFNKKKINRILNVDADGNCFVDENLKLIYLKNFTFKKGKLFSFYSNEDTVIVLDNCVFNENHLSFYKGDVKIIKPVCLGKKDLKVTTVDVVNFHVVISNNQYSNNPILYNLSAKNIMMNGGNPYFEYINAGNISFENIKNINTNLFLFNLKNLFIRNCNVSKFFYVDVLEKINLENVVFDVGIGSKIDIKSPTISTNNVIVKSSDFVLINGSIYSASEVNCIFNNKDDLNILLFSKRREFVSILGKYRNLVEDNLVKRKNDLLKDYFRKMDECEAMLISELINLKKDRIVTTKKLEMKLREKPCSKYVD